MQETSIQEKPVIKVSDGPIALQSAQQTADEFVDVDEITQFSESPVRSITPFTDISRTEELHTSQIDDSVIEELPLRREDRKKEIIHDECWRTYKEFTAQNFIAGIKFAYEI